MRKRLVWWTALPLLVVPAAAASAQAQLPEQIAVADDAEGTVEFSADQVAYDSENDIVSASGRVRMERDGNYLAADRVVWDRRTGEVRAEGNVVVMDPQGTSWSATAWCSPTRSATAQ